MKITFTTFITLILIQCTTSSHFKNTAVHIKNRMEHKIDLLNSKSTCYVKVFQGIGIKNMNYLSWTFQGSAKNVCFLLEKSDFSKKFHFVSFIEASCNMNIELMKCYIDSNLNSEKTIYRLSAFEINSIKEKQNLTDITIVENRPIIIVETNNPKAYFSLNSEDK